MVCSSRHVYGSASLQTNSARFAQSVMANNGTQNFYLPQKGLKCLPSCNAAGALFTSNVDEVHFTFAADDSEYMEYMLSVINSQHVSQPI
jgi:hypothetical protein